MSIQSRGFVRLSNIGTWVTLVTLSFNKKALLGQMGLRVKFANSQIRRKLCCGPQSPTSSTRFKEKKVLIYFWNSICFFIESELVKRNARADEHQYRSNRSDVFKASSVNQAGTVAWWPRHRFDVNNRLCHFKLRNFGASHSISSNANM